MNPWTWLTTADPTPGFTRTKLLKILARTLLFVLVVTLLQTLLFAVGLGAYLKTWWGTLLLITVVYIPFFRLMTLDQLVGPPAQRPLKPGQKPSAAQASQVRIAKRAEKNALPESRRGRRRTWAAGGVNSVDGFHAPCPTLQQACYTPRCCLICALIFGACGRETTTSRQGAP